MTGMMGDPAFGVAKSPQHRASAGVIRRTSPGKSDIRGGAKRLERDQQKWIPVLRPIALSNIENAHDLFAKPLTLWRIMR